MPVFVKRVGDAVPTSPQPDEMRDDSAHGAAVAKVVDPEGFKAGGAEVVELLEPEPLSIGVGRGTSLACGFHMCKFPSSQPMVFINLCSRAAAPQG